MSQLSPHINLYSLWLEGKMEPFITRGAIRPVVVKYCEIYHEYLKHRTAGKNYIEACEAAADEMCTSSDTVKRAIAEVM